MSKINWNDKRDELKEAMNPCPVWVEGTENQQDFADNLVENFCKRVAKYFTWAIKEGFVEEVEIVEITNHIFEKINEIDDAKWWCNKKSTNDKIILIKLLNDYDDDISIIKKIYQKYD